MKMEYHHSTICRMKAAQNIYHITKRIGINV